MDLKPINLSVIIFCFLASFACTEKNQSSISFHAVKNGKADLLELPGDICVQKKDHVECASKKDRDRFNNSAYFSKPLADSNFHIKAKISLQKIGETTSLFTIFGNHFGFDSDEKGPGTKNRLFLYNPYRDSLLYFNYSNEVYLAGKPFILEFIRKDELLTILIDNQIITQQAISFFKQPFKGTIGFRPWNNTIRIYEWSVTASLPKEPDLNWVFKRGEGTYSCFRIPSIIETAPGHLIAFAEGRKNSCRDNGNVDLVYKRSLDSGKTWGPLQVLWDDSTNTCAYPVPVVDRISGRLSLLCVWNLGEDHWSDIFKRQGKDSRRVFLFHTEDEGLTWTPAIEISQSVKRPEWDYYGVGSGSGLQLNHSKNKGRLIVPAFHSVYKDKPIFRSHIIYSDDGGLSWNIGGITPDTNTSEGEIAELSDGCLMLNMVHRAKHIRQRSIAYSYHAGTDLADQKLEPALIGSTCQGSLDSYFNNTGQKIVLFSNPNHVKERKTLSLQISPDDGKTWIYNQQLFEGPSSYSDLLIMQDGSKSVLFECGNVWPFEGIAFKQFELE